MISFLIIERFRGADQTDSPDGDQIILILCVGIIFLYDIRHQAKIVDNKLIARLVAALGDTPYAVRLLLGRQLLGEHIFPVEMQAEKQQIFQRDLDQNKHNTPLKGAKMEKITIYSHEYPMSREYFLRLFEILEYSFPKSERRGSEEHFSEFKKPAFRSMVLDDGTMSGFMNFWILDGFIYLEHFAVAKEMRGQGLGAYLMDELKKISGGLPIILEAEPPEINDTASRRVRFYERLGFVLNGYKYLQPPYNDGEQPLPLAIMSFPNALSRDGFLRIRSELYRGAYEVPESSDLYSAEI